MIKKSAAVIPIKPNQQITGSQLLRSANKYVKSYADNSSWDQNDYLRVFDFLKFLAAEMNGSLVKKEKRGKQH